MYYAKSALCRHALLSENITLHPYKAIKTELFDGWFHGDYQGNVIFPDATTTGETYIMLMHLNATSVVIFHKRPLRKYLRHFEDTLHIFQYLYFMAQNF